MAQNHVPFAMSCWWLYATMTNLPIEVQGTMTAAIGGMMPDLDHPESALGRRMLLVSVPISSLCGHRGVTHSLLAVVVLLWLLVAVTTLPAYQHLAWLITPLIIGYLSHILGDSLTPSGVPLLWPRKGNYSFNLFKTRSWQETVCVGIFTIGTVLIFGVWERAFADFLATVPKFPRGVAY